MLDEVHLPSNCSLADDEVCRLKHLKPQLGQHGGHKVWISVGKQRHVSYQAAAVKADYLLEEEKKRMVAEIRQQAEHSSSGLCV